MDVVLSTTIKEAVAGTDTVEMIGKSVPAPAAALSIETVALTAEVPFTLAATIWLILNTLPLDAAFDNNTLAVVLAGVRYVVVPYAVVAARRFGFAMFSPYRPKINEITVALA
jgi:hypothetical protein